MMPEFIGNDSLIARINEVEGCMYRQSNELGRLNKAVSRYKAENARLKKFAELDESTISALNSCMDDLNAENSKLRDLVQDYDKMLSSMYALCDCDFVPLNDAVLIGLRSRMYNLGIEVKE